MKLYKLFALLTIFLTLTSCNNKDDPFSVRTMGQ